MVKLLVTILLIVAGAVFYLNPAGFLSDLNFSALNLLNQKIEFPLGILEEKSATTTPIKTPDISKRISAPPPLKNIKIAPETTLTKTGIIVQTNIQRTQNNLPIFKEDEKLNAAALAKAKDILEKQYFAHESPTGVGASDLMAQAGYEYVIIGENLALGNFDSDQDVVSGWMNSPGHRANILNSKFTEIGVGAVKGVYENRIVWVAVQEFGKPLSDCPGISLSLKSQIESNEIQLNQWAKDLAAIKAEMESLNPRSNTYRQKADEYNALVEEYNSLVKATRQMVAEYNNQVSLFNICVQAP